MDEQRANLVHGELVIVRRTLEAILAELEVAPGAIDYWRTGNAVPAGGTFEYDAKGTVPGILLLNESTFDVYVGFAPHRGTATGRDFTLAASGFAELAQEWHYLSLGSAANCTVTFAALRRAPAHNRVG